ncbi:hypothetical protein PS15p_212327 [Mucor circinelloides]
MSPMNRQCPDCNALLYTEELLKNKFSMCCKQGKVYLEPLPNPPEALRTLLTSSDDESRDYRRNVRAYNNSFAFTSLGAKQDAQYSGRFEDNLKIDPHLNCQYAENYRQVVDIAFGDISTTASQTTFIDTTVLAATNAVVDQINDLAIMAFPGDHTTYLSEDRYIIDSGLPSTTSVEHHLNRIKPSGMPPHELNKLKVNQPIMCLMRSINPRNGLCNGTRLIVRSLMRNTIEAEIGHGEHRGKFVCIPRVSLYSDPDTADLEGKLSKRQFSVHSAFAMTINKAQGQTEKRGRLIAGAQSFRMDSFMWHSQE